jgi:excinuclease ABC subunit C
MRSAVRDAQLFLEGRHAELERAHARMMAAAEAEQFEAAARLRDQLSTVHQLQEKQRIATAEQGDDADVFGYHFEDGSWPSTSSTCAPERSSIGASSSGKICRSCSKPFRPKRRIAEGSRRQTPIVSGHDFRRAESQENETTEGFSPEENTGGNTEFPRRPGLQRPAQAALHRPALRSALHPRPGDFDDREALAALLSERTGHRIEIAVPQRGEKRSLVDLAGQNAKQSYTQRFRVLEPSRKAIQEALADALMLPELPRRIECFDISHIQGAETVASLVVWEDGKMNKQAYRKFKVMTVLGVDDFASMREVVTRRYRAPAR